MPLRSCQPSLPISSHSDPIPAAQYDEDDLPLYETSSSHLKARDAWLVDRVTREFATAYAQVCAHACVCWRVRESESEQCYLARTERAACCAAAASPLPGAPHPPTHPPTQQCPQQLIEDVKWTTKTFQQYWGARCVGI